MTNEDIENSSQKLFIRGFYKIMLGISIGNLKTTSLLLMDGYAECGLLGFADQVIDEMSQRDTDY